MPDARPSSPAPSPLPRAALPAALGLTLLVVFVLAFPARTYGDDTFFVQCIVRAWPFAPHFLFMPAARGTSWLLAHAGIDPFTSLRLLSAAGVALGGVFLVLAARARGLGDGAALAFAAVPLTAASTLFFATAAEVHGLHFGAVALALFLCARLRPGAPVRDVFLAALSFGVVVGTHQSGVLLLPALLGAYLVATPGRAGRWRDALALAGAGALSVAAMLLLRLHETGQAFAGEDSPAWFVQGIRAKIANGYGLEQMVRLLSGDAFGAALPATLAGGLAVGALGRRRPRRAALALVALLPYFLFFPLFGYVEHGAYFLVTLPVHAAAAFLVAREDRRVGLAIGLLALAAWVAPGEWTRLLGDAGPTALYGASLVVGLLLAGGARPARHALLPLAALALVQAVGAARGLAAYAAETPLLDWLRGACRANGGRDTYLIEADPPRYWALRLVDAPWPEPWAGTWELLDEVPLPGPHGFVYGDPNLTGPALVETVDGLLRGGTEIWIGDSVRTFLAQKPGASGDLRLLEAAFDREPVASGPFHAERLLVRP